MLNTPTMTFLTEEPKDRRAGTERRGLKRDYRVDRRQMSVAERADLEAEAGHKFLREQDAHLYRLRKIHAAAVAELLK